MKTLTLSRFPNKIDLMTLEETPNREVTAVTYGSKLKIKTQDFSKVKEAVYWLGIMVSKFWKLHNMKVYIVRTVTAMKKDGLLVSIGLGKVL
jgi:hypothetical protein